MRGSVLQREPHRRVEDGNDEGGTSLAEVRRRQPGATEHLDQGERRVPLPRGAGGDQAGVDRSHQMRLPYRYARGQRITPAALPPTPKIAMPPYQHSVMSLPLPTGLGFGSALVRITHAS